MDSVYLALVNNFFRFGSCLLLLNSFVLSSMLLILVSLFQMWRHFVNIPNISGLLVLFVETYGVFSVCCFLYTLHNCSLGIFFASRIPVLDSPLCLNVLKVHAIVVLLLLDLILQCIKVLI